MGRIKWNLDLLEEVKKQHGEAMTATEQVINNGKSDLSSMTEEVWEGEDADMARDQLHDLLSKDDTCKDIMAGWLGYGYYNKIKTDSNDYKTYIDCSDIINPLYVKTMKKWEEKGLLTIMKETGVWTEETCNIVAAAFTYPDTDEYKILFGGVSFKDINYADFNSAMIKIGNKASSGTGGQESLHDYWEEAALKEATNEY
jgi:uncharacterized protein YukE